MINVTDLQNFKSWIFDMDGTLTVAAHDFDGIREELGIAAGTPILEAIEGMPAAQAATTSARLHQLELDIAAQSTAQPYAHEMLEHLQKRGVSLGILTRNARDIAQVTLQAAQLSDYFDDACIIGREQCAPKPDPAGILRLMQQWQSTAETTIMVGDYVFDLQAGRNAGVATVHFDTTAQYPWPEHTDFAVDHLSQLVS
ncbi:MAG: HAD family hydrolase [Pseudomonadota bacterium]